MASKRVQWMASKVALAYGGEQAAADAFFAENDKKVSAFLNDPRSPPKLFVYQQTNNQLFMSVVGDGDQLVGKVVYFVRNVHDGKPVPATVECDTKVLCGELEADILQNLKYTLDSIYSPFLEGQKDWGKIEQPDVQNGFIKITNKFGENLGRKIANLSGDVTLKTPDDPFNKIEQKPAAYARSAKNAECLNHFRKIVASWCDSITKYMEDDPSSSPIDTKNNDGPEIEVEYWSRRMLTLISVTEQLKTRPSRVVTGVLKARALRTSDGTEEEENALETLEIKGLIERWREVDLAITDSLNESKDNVRFLENLKRVMEPLYSSSPSAVVETMPSLMNSMKMIHTLSRHYGSSTRMTNLFSRITNQLIKRCTEDIYEGQTVAALWNQEPTVVIAKMQASIELGKVYKAQYVDTKTKLAEMPKGKQFDFDESVIFGKFTKFTRRLQKLIDMFSSIEQFRLLTNKRIDGLEKHIATFNQLVTEFKMKGHDLLDFNNTVFERDFVEFTMHNSGLENAIQTFMETRLNGMSSILKQLELMAKFQKVMVRPALHDDLDNKMLMLFKSYGQELDSIEQLYDKHKEDPPLPRNMSQIAGNIHWSRQFLRRITYPMKIFRNNPKVFHPKESKKIVRNYNRLAKTLIQFETLWFQAWTKSAAQAKNGLRSRLLVVDPPSKEIHVNFDPGVLTLMREAKHLQLMGFEIPNSAKVVRVLEDQLKSSYYEVVHALQKYKACTAKVRPVTHSIIKPILEDLEDVIRPGFTTMVWTSMNLGPFLQKLHGALNKFEALVMIVNDIIDNRIDVNVQFVGSLLLLNMPDTETFTLEKFRELQKSHVAATTEVLIGKNIEIERAVDDLIKAITDYKLSDDTNAKLEQIDINFLKLHYGNKVYQKLLKCTKQTLEALRNRVNAHTGHSIISHASIFEIGLRLEVPEVKLSPKLEEVHETINSVAREVLQATKKVYDWGIDATARARSPKPFYDKLAADKNIVVVLLLLTGSTEDAKRTGTKHLVKYQKYSWLWNEEPAVAYTQFVEKESPILEDFVSKIQYFIDVQEEITNIPTYDMIGPLALDSHQLKAQLKHETQRWIHQFSEKLHQEAKRDMYAVIEQMSDLQNKLEREVKDIASLKFVMDAQSEMREMESWVQNKFDAIISRYNKMENYLPPGAITKEEMDSKSVIISQWTTIKTEATRAMKTVREVQDSYRTDLIREVKVFRKNVKVFRADYDKNGPMVEGIAPKDAMTRLGKYKREFETLNRKYELYSGGEKLFGLPAIKYPELAVTKKELSLLDKLYSLYHATISTIDEYKGIAWTEVVANIQTMNETVESFASKAKTLPKALKQWDAYKELNKTIEDFIEVLPLLTELSKQSMRDRHWKEISELTGKEFDLEKFHELKLKSVLEANLLEFREDIEEITDSADKQLAIETKLAEIAELWTGQDFSFGEWKERGEVILAGGRVGEIIEILEESQSALVQMLTQRHVTPFREKASTWLKKLSDVNDTLELWIKVQMLWMSLEAVFTGGDIARQMPQDTRVFMNVDKEWTTRTMPKAKDVLNVVETCQNEYIKNMLPAMFIDLEKCQKALDGYLEAKRNKFPRFYFVSNPALLQILSQGSDKEAVQQCFAKCFDSVERVEFTGNNITGMMSLSAGMGGKMDIEKIPLDKPVAAKGNIEDWLNLLLKRMERSMKTVVKAGCAEVEALPLTDYVKKYCAQMCLLAIQVMWTTDVQEALVRCKSDKGAIMNAYKKQSGVLTELANMTTQEIPTKMERRNVETLVTIQVHSNDVLEDLVKLYKVRKLKDHYDFEWQKQLRCYWEPEVDNLLVKVADVDFGYCYEYLGCKERLVITPLTDRCYITLTQAIGMKYGGAPAGPAGTGKTETTKDLGRALGKYVVVFNCSDQMHTPDTAKIYKGLCQSGSWGCFDEFNRIDLEVLSVVAQQVQAILQAQRARQKFFVFPGDDTTPINVDPRVGFFITMNPGYAGRQELPENLKALFRGVAMMVPDREIIIKVKLASVGYMTFAPLSVKFRVLYRLCEEQLSKQRHYDFGLRNILSVLRTAGFKLREELAIDASRDRNDLEEMLLMRTLRDMNLSKFVADDVPLFISLLHDLFPNQPDPAKAVYPKEEEAIEKIIGDYKLISFPSWVNKIIQLYETKIVRHGLMMVGDAGGGKTTAIQVLIDCLTVTNVKHIIVKMNPKAIMATEMFGNNDVVSGEWSDGIFSAIWSKYNDNKRPHHTWIVCDGPVDAIWIENLNTVLDDNKLLTLANGDRIPMTDNCRILFEVQDLRNASPATVSRAGIVLVSAEDLGYAPIVESWMNSRRGEEKKILEALYERYVEEPEALKFLSRNTNYVMPTTRAHCVTSMLSLLEALLSDSVKEQVIYPEESIEKIFVYCFMWSLGGLLEAEDRLKLDKWVQAICPPELLPPYRNETDTVYEFYVDVKAEGHPWTEWVAPEWEYPGDQYFDFATSLIPTVDSTRAEYLIDELLHKVKKPVLILGGSGTAKTSLVLQYTENFDPTQMMLKKVNFSSATTSGMFQTSMEADIEKRQGKTYAPPGGRKMVVFLDDVSMPEVNNWGDQPTLEIVRQLVEEGGIMFLEKDKRGERMNIENVLFIGAMSHPGGGRNDIPNRLKRHFFAFNMPPPSNASVDNIYGSMLRGRYEEKEEFSELVESLTSATIEMWNKSKLKMLPTPAKFHYIFNLRDISRIFQGILFSPTDVITNTTVLVELWEHECARVLCDKLVNDKDKTWYLSESDRVLSEKFPEEIVEVMKARTEPCYFVDYLRNDIIDEETDQIAELAPKIYERVPDNETMKTRVKNFLADYNAANAKQMNLVLFKDALEHMMRISRIIGMPRGNALLVGVGGSGRQSLTRLAAFIGRQEAFQIALTRTYKIPDFLEDIRKLYTMVGKEGKKCTWVFTDFEIINENFLEYINAILATGEIAGLFPKDERDMMCSDLRAPAKKEIPDFDDTPDNLYKYFIDRIRKNLHIVLCFSPANEKFPERARKFPGLLSTAIDWFLRWPEQALKDVAQQFIREDPTFELEASEDTKEKVVNYIARVHDLVTISCDEYFESYRRAVFVTPKSYLAFIDGYKAEYKVAGGRIDQSRSNVTIGLEKLDTAERDVDKMKDVLAKQEVELAEADKAATAMLAKLEVSSKEAGEKKKVADGIAAKCNETAKIIETEKAAANKELEAAMPFVYAANDAAKSVNKKDIGLIQKFAKPPDLIRRIMDCVLILFSRPLEKVDMMEIKTGKDTFEMFIMDSYDTSAKKMMMEVSFVGDLLEFANTEKDKINEETMELLDPYLEVKDFNPERAKQVANAAEGLCKWCKAMHSYHIAAVFVAPKIEELKVKSALFDAAMAKLRAAEASSAEAQATVDGLQAQFQETMDEKARLEETARLTQEKMVAANNLISSLGGEKVRWSADRNTFAENKIKLVGDCALACAFVSYLGPFNHTFRKKLLDQTFYNDCVTMGIPVTKGLNVISFLCDDARIAEWNSQGLPKDDLSVQNGILVTRSSRYPLMIDPQNQAYTWLKRRENDFFPTFGTTSLSNPKLRDQLEFCMEEGKPLLVEGIVKEVDPMFDPVLEKNITYKGRSMYITLGDKRVGFDKNFRLYFLTKLGNPTFSPELCAKTTVIDFSVTVKGLEDQLLSRVIQNEQASLEEQRQELVEQVNLNTIALQELDKLLLEKLSASKGNLLEDIELIQVLANTKVKSVEVKEKIEAAAETEIIINKKREQYRPVACRGSVIYFVIVSLAGINVMYQNSLAQFLGWFDESMERSEKANLVQKRVEILMDYLTFHVYISVERGLFEKDKIVYKMLVATQVTITEKPQELNASMVGLFLKAGAALSADQVSKKPYDWLQQTAWINIQQLALSLDFFADIKAVIEQNAAEFKAWYELEAPEEAEIPKFEERLLTHPAGPFYRLLLLRSMRDDRLRPSCSVYLASLFCMGPRYTQPVPLNYEEIWGVTNKFIPCVLLLTPGADPTATLEDLAKKKGLPIRAVSMGEGQEPHAAKCMNVGMDEGGWALLQNCHLGLGFMEHINDDLAKAAEEKEVDDAFRLWITCEPHKDFPINLLQIAVKVTNEPPAGMKAGLFRSYTSVIDGERLARVETSEWKNTVFILAFMHSVVQERRKFGSIGFCIPYEFNTSDLEASLTFLEKHSFGTMGWSWPTVQYMICEAQYGGRITDDYDRILFNSVGINWLAPESLEPGFEFCKCPGDFKYIVPKAETIEHYRAYITSMPASDSPEIFGLNTNADLTYGSAEATYIIDTINETQPKETGGGSGGLTREQQVWEICDELVKKMDDKELGYVDEVVREQIKKRPKAEVEFVLGYKPDSKVDGFSIPLNVTLYQEIVRLNYVIDTVRGTFNGLKQAIDGEIIMTNQLQDSLNSIFDAKPPKHWYIDPSGAQYAWTLPSLGLWIEGLFDREVQLSQWINTTRPNCYWMTGMFNPQGFLTAARQEVTRRHAAEKWALDDVVLISYFTDWTDTKRIKGPPDEGIYINGMFVEGAGWNKATKMLCEATPKEMYAPMPVVHVSAVTSEQEKKIFSKGEFYECPVYTVPKRNGLAYIFTTRLPSEVPARHWTLRGVALLCSKD